MFNDLITKMKNSGIWEGKPFSDKKLAKLFKQDFKNFVQE